MERLVPCILDYIDESKYDSIQKDGLSVLTIVAKDGMVKKINAERLLIKRKKKEFRIASVAINNTEWFRKS